MSDFGTIMTLIFGLGCIALFVYLVEKSTKYDSLSKNLFFINKRIKLMELIEKKLEETKRDPINDIDPIDAILSNVSDEDKMWPLQQAIRNGEKLVKVTK